MSPTYIGVDIADDLANRSRVELQDDGEQLTVAAVLDNYGDVLAGNQIAALDSPLGYPVPFGELVSSLTVLDIEPWRFKYRLTEAFVADLVSNLPFIEESGHAVPQFFNRGSHVKPAVGLEIVPGAVREAMRLLGVLEAGPEERQAAIQHARAGDGPVLEAHPRLFLYSLLARIRAHLGDPLPVDLLTAARLYKTPAGARAAEAAERLANRNLVLGYIIEHSEAWLVPARALAHGPVCDRDHDFDAFLCALTAFAHAHGQTLGWEAFAGLNAVVVHKEGHMLILAPADGGHG